MKVGDVVVFKYPDGKVQIVEAKPRVYISEELLEKGQPKYIEIPGEIAKDQSLILKDDFGNKYTYKFMSYNFVLRAWLIEWPD